MLCLKYSTRQINWHLFNGIFDSAPNKQFLSEVNDILTLAAGTYTEL